MILANYGIIASSGGVSFDADAQAFITAASITDNTQKTAINTLVTDLKTYNIWTKMKAIYPFVGGAAAQHRFNLKDPRPLSAAFYLDFIGGWTHSSTGALPNGANAYADTKFTPSVSWSLSNAHSSYYSRSNISLTSNQILFDAFIAGSTCHQLYFDSASSSLVNDMFDVTNGDLKVPFSNLGSRTDGMFIGNRANINSNKIFKNGTLFGSNTNGSGILPNIPLYLAAANTITGAVAFSSLQTAFASIGDGLSDTDASNFYSAVQSFQTTLSRNV
jgi:hypothetical protein